MKEFRNMTENDENTGSFESELTTIRAGRANPHILTRLQ